MVKKSDKVYKLSKKDILILKELNMNFPIGFRVNSMSKNLGINSGTIYRRLFNLRRLGLVINKYPTWTIKLGNYNKIRKINKEDYIYVDTENNELINLKKDRCYFCGYNKVLDEHHIIERKNGGTNKKSNILILCPNCHTLLHRSGYNIIKFKEDFKMVNSNGETILLPFKEVKI